MEMESVYCAVGTGSLNETVYALSEGEFVMYCIYVLIFLFAFMSVSDGGFVNKPKHVAV
jgi:hypothetical protein